VKKMERGQKLRPSPLVILCGSFDAFADAAYAEVEGGSWTASSCISLISFGRGTRVPVGHLPDLKPRLFEPFSRGHSGEEGSGLGLHLAREIARAQGGDLCHLDSETGAVFKLIFHGGRFTLTFDIYGDFNS
jgi:K+-sensing histidine kinase KdpD